MQLKWTVNVMSVVHAMKDRYESSLRFRAGFLGLVNNRWRRIRVERI